MAGKQYLNARLISDEVILSNRIKSTSTGSILSKITIPVFDKAGVFLFNKYRHFDREMKYTYDKGSCSCLYNIQNIDREKKTIYITEGEFDTCVLQSAGYNSVSSTGGAGSFDIEWLKDYKGDMNFIICFDSDKAGYVNSVKLYIKMLDAKFNVSILEMLPVGKLNDVTDYYVMGYSKKFHDLKLISDVFKDLTKSELEAKRNESANHQYYSIMIGIKSNKDQLLKKTKIKKKFSDNLDSIKDVPIDRYIDFNRQNKAPCLWHNDKNPSLILNSQDGKRFNNTVHCYSCGFHGSVIDVIMKQRGIPFPQAVDYIKKDLNIE